jgi:hypothetical protein
VGAVAVKALRALLGLAAASVIAMASAQQSAGTDAASAAGLRSQYSALVGQYQRNPFQRPLRVDSSEGPDGLKGEITALVEHPFAIAVAALDTPSQWCEILILHLNTKYCRATMEGERAILHVVIGKKYDQPMEQAYRVDFVYRVAAESRDYLQVELTADEGPLGTRDYRIVLEAAPVDGGRTFVRLSYSYSYGMIARLAMQVYLATVGRGKVGFTVEGKGVDGQPRYIAGMRGVTERNAMRYYLAVESYLGALSVPPRERAEKSFRDWFDAIERYPRQLHEMQQGEYLAMKRREYTRQIAKAT